MKKALALAEMPAPFVVLKKKGEDQNETRKNITRIGAGVAETA